MLLISERGTPRRKQQLKNSVITIIRPVYIIRFQTTLTWSRLSPIPKRKRIINSTQQFSEVYAEARGSKRYYGRENEKKGMSKLTLS